MKFSFAILILLALPLSAEAHAEIFFPKIFSLSELSNTGFVLLNADPTIATVNFYLLAANGQALTFGKTRHHLQGIAEDHAVRPVLIVLIEVCLIRIFWHAVEVGEQIELRRTPAGVLTLLRLATGRRSGP